MGADESGAECLHRGEGRRPDLHPPRVLVTGTDQQHSRDAQGALDGCVGRALRQAHDLGQRHVDRTLSEILQSPERMSGEIDAHGDLVHENEIACAGIPLRAHGDMQMLPELAVGASGIVASQIDVESARATDRSHESQVRGLIPADPGESRVSLGRVLDPGAPARRGRGEGREQVGHGMPIVIVESGRDPADASEPGMHACTGDGLQDARDALASLLHLCALAPGDNAEEGQARGHALDLEQQYAGPRGALGGCDAQCILCGEGGDGLGHERGQPVMTIGEQHGLPQVTRLEELLGAPVHEPDAWICPRDAIGFESDVHLESGVRGGVTGIDRHHGVAGESRDRSHGEHDVVRHVVILTEQRRGHRECCPSRQRLRSGR